MKLRPATLADAEAILNCLYAAFEPHRQDYSPEGFADTTLTRDTLQQRLSLMQIVVAGDERNPVIGTISFHLLSPEEGHIRGMAVLPGMHGSGVAAQLLAHAEASLRSMGARRATLDTTAPLQRAIRFYEKHGYVASGKIRDFFGMPLFEYVKQL